MLERQSAALGRAHTTQLKDTQNPTPSQIQDKKLFGVVASLFLLSSNFAFVASLPLISRHVLLLFPGPIVPSRVFVPLAGDFLPFICLP